MSYSVKIDMSRMVDKLAQIEAGNPIRFHTSKTLHDATAFCNIARMVAGLGMLRGVRSIAPGQLIHHNMPNDPVQCEIQRIKKGVKA